MVFALLIMQNINFVFANDDSHQNIEDFQALLDKLIYYDSVQDTDSLNYYIHLAEKNCEKINTKKGYESDDIEVVGEIYTFIAQQSISKNLLLEAIINLTHAERLYGLIKNEKQVAIILTKKADTYIRIGNQIKALENYYRAVLVYENLDESEALAKGYINLASIYQNQQNHKLAIENIEKALAITKELNNPGLLSRIKRLEAEMKDDMNEFLEALKLYEEALSFAKVAADDKEVTQILNKIGSLYLKNNQLDRSIVFFREAYDLAIEKSFPYDIALSLVNLGRYHQRIGFSSKAIAYGKDALELAENIKNDDIKSKAILLLLNIYKDNNDWKNSFYYQELLIEQKEKNEKKIINQIVQQETHRMNIEKNKILSEQKKVENVLRQEKEEQGRKIIYLIAGVIIILLIAVVFLFYSRLQASKEKNKIILKQSEERKLLLQEVHHRVKNNFQIVSSMLRLQSYGFENEELRQNFTEAVSRINSMAMVHEVIYQQEKFRDLDIKVYLHKLIEILQKTSHSNVNFIIESESVPFKIETLISIGIALNELITNSFKHAFNLEVYNPKIKISLKVLKDGQILLVYQDNGVGINKSNLKQNFGMDLIETIIDNYDGTLEIVDTNKEWPTTIEIVFKE